MKVPSQLNDKILILENLKIKGYRYVHGLLYRQKFEAKLFIFKEFRK
jgi:hypothetical protein